MRPMSACIATALGLASTLTPTSTFGFDVVQGGRPAAAIVTPDNPTEIVQDAVTCLNAYIEKISGTRLQVIEESGAAGEVGNLVVLGDTRMAWEAGIDVSAIAADGYIHKVAGKRFFIAGPDEALSAKIKDSDNAALHELYTLATSGTAWRAVCNRRGTLNGVIRLLQDHCGVRWLIPAPGGEKVPASADIRVPDNLYKREEPAFTCAFARNSWGETDPTRIWVYKPGFYWAAANSFRIPISILFLGGHSWYWQVRIHGETAEKLFEAHPEYFAERRGGRTLGPVSASAGLCTSNLEVVDMLTTTMQQLFDQGWGSVYYNQSDGFRRCLCAKCEAMDRYRGYKGNNFFENPCERLFLPLNEIAQRCYQSHPDKKIIVSIYGPTRLPSEKIRRFPPNVTLRASYVQREDFEIWKGRGDIVSVWLYWLGTVTAPGVSVKTTPRSVAENLRLYHSYGVRMLYWGMTATGENWGNEGPVYYVMGQLMRNPNADYGPFLKEYYESVYGRAAGAMEEYFTLLYDRIDEHYYDKYMHFRHKDAWTVYAEEFFSSVYPPDFLKALERPLAEARALAQDERERNWLALTQNQFDYIKTTATVYHRYHAFLAEKTMATLRGVKEAIDERNAHLADLRELGGDPEYIRAWYPGYSGYLKMAPLGRKNRSALRDPFTWDFSDLDTLLAEQRAAKAPKSK